jgi:hypothetical protein
MEPFTLVAHLLDRALNALEIQTGQESSFFELELESVVAGNLCQVDLCDSRVRLWDLGHTGTWEIYSVTPMCPLCPDWDSRYPIGNDFFGSPCMINGVRCCETCYRVYLLTSEVKVGNNPHEQEVSHVE